MGAGKWRQPVRLQSGEGYISELRGAGCLRLVFKLEDDGNWTAEELYGWWTYAWVFELLCAAPAWARLQQQGYQRMGSLRRKHVRKNWLTRVIPAVEEDPETNMKVVDTLFRLHDEAAVLEWAEARYADRCERAARH